MIRLYSKSCFLKLVRSDTWNVSKWLRLCSVPKVLRQGVHLKAEKKCKFVKFIIYAICLMLFTGILLVSLIFLNEKLHYSRRHSPCSIWNLEETLKRTAVLFVYMNRKILESYINSHTHIHKITSLAEKTGILAVYSIVWCSTKFGD